MSAAAVELEPYAAPAPSRPHLRLVATPGSGSSRQRGGAPLRLTRAGRRVLIGVAVVLLALVGYGIAGAGAEVPAHTVSVRSGETLSDIAVREMPGVPVADAVARLELVNNLPGSTVGAGQVLQIPAIG